MMTFQSPALPWPVTVLRNPGGGWFSLTALKSNLCSAAATGRVRIASAQKKLFRMFPEANKKAPGDKCLYPDLAGGPAGTGLRLTAKAGCR